MTLLEQWRNKAYDNRDGSARKRWEEYFEVEKGVYEKLLENPDEEVRGTVRELAEKYGLSLEHMVGFLDGINDSLVTPNPIETMDEDTEVSLVFDKEQLYRNMVNAEAPWLYGLPQWEKIYDEETRKALYKDQKNARTVRREGKKIMPNDPCPCGSGKKYKKCHGAPGREKEPAAPEE